MEVVKDAAIATTGKAKDLTAGKLGVFNANDHTIAVAADPYIYIATGSYWTANQPNGFIFGAKQPSRTPGINAKYVTKFRKIAASASQNEIIIADSDGTAASAIPYYKGNVYRFYLEAQGSGPTDALGRFAIGEYDVFTGCVDGCSGGCDSVPVDPATVYLGVVNKINADPVMSKFVKATALVDGAAIDDTYVAKTVDTDIAAVKAGLKLEAAFYDISTSDCTFDQLDSYQKVPIHLIFTSKMADVPDTCVTVDDINSQYEHNSTYSQKAEIAHGYGEGVIREYIQSERYKQLDFSTSPKMREKLGDPILGAVARTEKYTRYYLEFAIPKFEMQTNSFNTNVFNYCFVVKESTGLASFETLIKAWLAANNPEVTMETV